MGEDAPEHDDGQALAVELDKEDAPRLAGGELAELADGLDLGGFRGLEAKLIGIVIEREVFGVVALQRPVQLVLETADELLEGADVTEVGGRHGSGLKSDAAFRRRGRWLWRRRHHLADGVENDLELAIVFLFHRLQLAGEVGMGGEHFTKTHKGAHDGDVHLDGA